MFMVAMYKGDSLRDMKLISGSADPGIISQVSTILKNALNDEDQELNSENNESNQA